MKKGLILLLMVLAAGGAYFFTQQQGKAITYLTETVQKGNLEKSVIATGSVRALQRVEVGAQASGKIEKIHVKLGQQLKAGDLIAEIDSQTQRNALETAQAKLASYQAQFKAKTVTYEIAKANFERNQTLYRQKSTSLAELDSAKIPLLVLKQRSKKWLRPLNKQKLK